jgi:uncharacterized protein with PQ loop repeat
MPLSIQTIYLFTSFLTVLATIPQLKQLIHTKQSDQFNLMTWLMFGGNQLMSFAYAISINATAYIIVTMAWISFYIIMLFLIIKYRKRRNLFATLAYWFQRGREPKHRTLSLQADRLLSVSTAAKEL